MQALCHFQDPDELMVVLIALFVLVLLVVFALLIPIVVVFLVVVLVLQVFDIINALPLILEGLAGCRSVCLPTAVPAVIL